MNIPRCFLLAMLASYGHLMSGAAPVIDEAGTRNAADLSRAICPGAVISILGQDLSPVTLEAPAAPLPTQLAGVSVEVTDGRNTALAPLYLVSPKQINAQLPYNVTGPTLAVTVKTEGGTSNVDRLSIAAVAPRFYTFTHDGKGRAAVLHDDYTVVNRAKPAKPGMIILVYLSGLGAVEPASPAGISPGDGSAGHPLNHVVAPVGVEVNGRAAEVLYAGLVAGSPGLYQVNFRMPFDDVAGDVEIAVGAEDQQTQAGVSIPVEPNGFYWTISAGKLVNDQRMNGLPGADSALAFRHDDLELWGERGLRTWSKETGFGSTFAASAGVAVTLRSNGAIVYDNNGIETGQTGGYYENRSGGLKDDENPGLNVMYSMSTRYPNVWAGCFRLREKTTVSEIIGYFDGNGQAELPFDPNNIYNRYRMNIWDDNPDHMPVNSGSFVGNRFSSDKAGGAFSVSDTGVSRVFQDGTRDPIYRLRYVLDAPIVLDAGVYWFSHDVGEPKAAAASGSVTAEAVGASSAQQYPRPKAIFTSLK